MMFGKTGNSHIQLHILFTAALSKILRDLLLCGNTALCGIQVNRHAFFNILFIVNSPFLIDILILSEISGPSRKVPLF